VRDTLILSLDPGITTGWALVSTRDKSVKGCGNLHPEDLGHALDRLVRCTHKSGNLLDAVVEKMPAPTTSGNLATNLEFVRHTIDHWLVEIFDLSVTYILPGTWKTSRVAITAVLPEEWNGKLLTQHQKDAIMIAKYHASRSKSKR
jgi:hypothetical protein